MGSATLGAIRAIVRHSVQNFVERLRGEDALGPLQQGVSVGGFDLEACCIRQFSEASCQLPDQDLGLALLDALLDKALCKTGHFVCLAGIAQPVDGSLIEAAEIVEPATVEGLDDAQGRLVSQTVASRSTVSG